MSSVQSQILDAVKTRLLTLAWAKSVNVDTIKLQVEDFKDHELPAIQVIAGPDVPTPVCGRDEVRWTFYVELVMKPSAAGAVGQKDLLDQKFAIKQAFGAAPQLGTTPVIQVRYTGGIPDLHLLQPFYLARMEFQVDYYEGYIDP